MQASNNQQPPEKSPGDIVKLIQKANRDKDPQILQSLNKDDYWRRSGSEYEPTRTVMHRAVMNETVDVVLFLLDTIKVDPNIEDDEGNGFTPLHMAASNNSDNAVKIAEILIEKGAKVNKFDRSDMSPLMYAILSSNPEMIELLLLNGAELYDHTGSSLLHYAAEEGADIALMLMIDKGASDEMKTSGAQILKKLKECESGIDEGYVQGFEEFLRLRKIHPVIFNP